MANVIETLYFVPVTDGLNTTPVVVVGAEDLDHAIELTEAQFPNLQTKSSAREIEQYVKIKPGKTVLINAAGDSSVDPSVASALAALRAAGATGQVTLSTTHTL